MRRKLVFTIISFLIITFILWFGLTALQPQPTEDKTNENSLTEEANNQQIDFSQPTPSPVNQNVGINKYKAKQTAWIPDWDFYNGFESLQQSWENFDSVSPVWYYLENKGKMRTNKVGYAEIRNFTKSKGIKLIPSVANFDAKQMHLVLSKPEKLQKHIDFLIKEIDKYNYDGIDLDYESIYIQDQSAFLYLVKSLYANLNPKGKELSVTVIYKWTNSWTSRAFRQTVKAQDWHEIGEYTHQLRIMAYDMTGAKSKYPGPVSPLDWNQAILRYASTQIDAKKVYLAMNHYVYDGWSKRPTFPVPYLSFVSNTWLADYKASAYTYSDTKAKFGKKVSNKLDPSSAEKVLIYNLNGKTYLAVYQDVETAKKRFDLVEKCGIAGLAYWRMGDEDTRIYDLH